MSGTYQSSILNFPCARRTRFVHVPTREIFSVEQRDRFSPFRDACSVQLRRPTSGPLPRSAVLPSGCSREGVAHKPSLKDHVVLPVLLFFRGDERNVTVRDFNLGKRSHISPTAHHLRPQLSIFLSDFQPRRIFMVGRLQRQIPSSQERLD